jgi:hypothetical protein
LPPPSYDDLRRFCELDGWEELSRVRGGTGDHRRYRKVLPDGTILRTKVSHGKGEIGDPGLWRRIWREQLGLASEEEFWRALREGRGVDRGGVSQSPPAGPSIPGWVVDGLLRAGVDGADLRGLTADEARRRLEDIWAQPRDEPVD